MFQDFDDIITPRPSDDPIRQQFTDIDATFNNYFGEILSVYLATNNQQSKGDKAKFQIKNWKIVISEDQLPHYSTNKHLKQSQWLWREKMIFSPVMLNIHRRFCYVHSEALIGAQMHDIFHQSPFKWKLLRWQDGDGTP